MKQTKTHGVPTDCFADDDAIVFLTEDKKRANKYGLWLRNKAGIAESKVYMQDLIGKDKSRGFWLNRLGYVSLSDFYCNDRYLYYVGGSLFGVYESAEGTSRKIHNPSLKEILKYSSPFIPQIAREEFEKGL